MSDPAGDPPRRGDRSLRRRLALAMLLPVGVGVQWLAAQAPERVDAGFSRGVFPWIRRAFAATTARSPVSVGEILIALLVLALLACAGAGLIRWRRGQGAFGRMLARGAALLLAVAGTCHVVFLAVWGLNYARPPLAARLGLSPAPATAGDLALLAEALARRAGELRAGLAEHEGVLRLRRGREHAYARLAEVIARDVVPGVSGPAPRARSAWLSPMLSKLGISGIYSPFTGEPHVNGQIPDASLPFVLCHEAAHAAGEAREDEANFTAWLWCRASGDAEFEYSGALAALGYALGALSWVDPEGARRIAASCDPAVRRDREAVAAFWESHRTALFEVSSRVNDLYLRTQGEEEGVYSYGRMVDLLLAWRGAGRGL